MSGFSSLNIRLISRKAPSSEPATNCSRGLIEGCTYSFLTCHPDSPSIRQIDDISVSFTSGLGFAQKVLFAQKVGILHKKSRLSHPAPKIKGNYIGF